MRKAVTLSIIILTYNVRDLTKDCLSSVFEAIDALQAQGYSAEIIVSDNASSDGTVDMIKQKFPSVTIFQNENIGFAKGNNVARPHVKSQYILILNPDTIVERNTLLECIKYMEQNSNVGAMTCRVELPNHQLDKDTRRSFPTPLTSLSHFLKLDRIFPNSKLFARYWYSYLPDTIEHPVDVIQGAFCLARRDVMEMVNWYDEDYFLDGEDIDLCWKIKDNGYTIMYYPKVKITHYKGASKGKLSSSKTNKHVSKINKIRAVISGSDSMKIFYDKHLKNKYPLILTYLIYFTIALIRLKRIIKIVLLGKR